VKEVLSEQMQPPFFPVTAEAVFRAQLDYKAFEAGDRLKLGDARISAIEANHPGGNLAYRVEHGGRVLIYATDHEHGERDGQLIEFARDADLIVYDAMYTDDEYHGREGSSKVGWGHSTWQSGVRIASEANVKSLVLFHHEPTRTDDALDELMRTVKRKFKGALAAREGLVIKL
jgi:ribonuclease BN (tRNA processing enzyme)